VAIRARRAVRTGGIDRNLIQMMGINAAESANCII
jgi:hypothetical protein